MLKDQAPNCIRHTQTSSFPKAAQSGKSSWSEFKNKRATRVCTFTCNASKSYTIIKVDFRIKPKSSFNQRSTLILFRALSRRLLASIKTLRRTHHSLCSLCSPPLFRSTCKRRGWTVWLKRLWKPKSSHALWSKNQGITEGHLLKAPIFSELPHSAQGTNWTNVWKKTSVRTLAYDLIITIFKVKSLITIEFSNLKVNSLISLWNSPSQNLLVCRRVCWVSIEGRP